MKMDTKLNGLSDVSKYDLVYDIIDHPERYTPGRIKKIMADPETRDLYNLLCKVDSAMAANADIDVDAEWEAFERKHTDRRRFMPKWFGSRAASITAIIGTSLAAVAAGIVVTVAVVDKSAEAKSESDVAEPMQTVAVANDAITVVPDSAKAETAPLLFEDESLETIMQSVANTYGVEVRFNNPEVAALHLYYKFNPALALGEVLSQLNTFEQINIVRNGNTLTID